MADNKNNFYSITGVIYSKPVRKVDSKKEPGKTFEFSSIILEVKSEFKGTMYIDLPEFELGKGTNTDDFAVGDPVEIFFSLSGKKVSDSWHKTTIKAKYMKHQDIQSGVTDVADKTPRELYKKEVFVAPNSLTDDNGDDDNLPF